MVWNLLALFWNIGIRIPGFLAGGRSSSSCLSLSSTALVIATLCLGAVGFAVYFVLFCIGVPTGIPETEVETEIRQKVIKEWETPESAEHHEAYRCGWVCLTSEFHEHPPIDLSILQKLKNSHRTRPNNVYFLVLKHKSLFLYEGEDQLECAGAAVIEGCKIDLFPHSLLLDEIYKKEFPLRVVSPASTLFDGQKRLYLYAANASEKEDWLFALRQGAQAASPPAPKDVDPSEEESGEDAHSLNSFSAKATAAIRNDPKIADAIFMERLNRYVRAPSMDTSTQWLNAIAGRLFFNMFRSNDLERFFRKKFERKAATIPKPFFLGDLVLKSVFAGQSLPMFSRGQLHSVTNEGELLVSVDIMYPGGFRMQIETEIRWEIPKVKTIVVPIVMSIHVRRMTGRVLLRIKPPPSDRLWVGFYAPPALDIDMEPVVSSKAITWSVVKAGIMKHIYDTMTDVIVLPNMDDLTIPPLIIGDCYGGEKPFELDYLPPSLLSQACKLDLTAHGISAMRSSREALDLNKAPGSPVIVGGILSQNLLTGSHHSLPDLVPDADLSMESLSTVAAKGSVTGSPKNLLEEARLSDRLAQERLIREREKLVVTSYLEEQERAEKSQASQQEEPRSSTDASSTSNSSGSGPREMITNVRKSVTLFLRNRASQLRSEVSSLTEGDASHRGIFRFGHHRRGSEHAEQDPPSPAPLNQDHQDSEHLA